MRRSFRPLLAALLLTFAAACATAPPRPPVQTTRTVGGPPAEVRARVEVAMRGLGLDARPDPSGLRAETRGGAKAEWAECRAVLVYDFDSEETRRSDWAHPGARDSAVSASFAPAAGGGTQVTVAARFGATYTNRFKNQPETAACASNGVVESALLDAAGGGGS